MLRSAVKSETPKRRYNVSGKPWFTTEIARDPEQSGVASCYSPWWSAMHSSTKEHCSLTRGHACLFDVS
ncbi:hypothetical protein OPV22_022535 [Ensete ventricosum]|uniref:Uncharacterized protein n=1 Tax=Ensete ventricosum TaxID=4639 RepID=A0AAV8QQ24_ENSVE|nr:hypothetical protein OPV22_022535 [Ensete ventricosum]